MDNVFVMAGIPEVMQAMFESLVHRLVGGKPLISRSVTVFLPESKVALGLEALQGRYSDVEMGSYPFNRAGRFGTRLVLRATEAGRLDAAAGELDGLIVELGSEPDWE
jgi:molybdopterin-biosynthesis enzyme MoeA-like protein